MDRGRYDFIAIAPGQFLDEHHVPLVNGKPSMLSMNSMLVVAEHTNLLWLYNAFLVYLRLRGVLESCEIKTGAEDRYSKHAADRGKVNHPRFVLGSRSLEKRG